MVHTVRIVPSKSHSQKPSTSYVAPQKSAVRKFFISREFDELLFAFSCLFSIPLLCARFTVLLEAANRTCCMPVSFQPSIRFVFTSMRGAGLKQSVLGGGRGTLYRPGLVRLAGHVRLPP